MSQRRRRHPKTAPKQQLQYRHQPITIHIIIRVIVPHIMEIINSTVAKRMEIVTVIIIITIATMVSGAMVGNNVTTQTHTHKITTFKEKKINK